MVLISLVALFLIGCSVALVARAIALPGLKSAERVRGIARYGFRSAPVEPESEVTGPVLSGVATAIGSTLASRLSGLHPEALRHDLISAGLYKVSPFALLGYRVLAGLTVGLAGFVLAGDLAFPGPVAAAALSGFVGWLAPLVLVRRIARQRLQAIDLELPDLIDLMVVTVEAGSGLAASLQLAGSKLEGPLAQEIRITLQEQRMGRSLGEALTHLVARADTPNMRSFTRAVVQGEQLGVSIGTIMRNLAVEMRARRRALAQQQAQKAPVKMLFPLVFLILPAFLVIVLGPALFKIAETLS